MFIKGKARVYKHEDFLLHLKSSMDYILDTPNLKLSHSESVFLLNICSSLSVHMWYYQRFA